MAHKSMQKTNHTFMLLKKSIPHETTMYRAMRKISPTPAAAMNTNNAHHHQQQCQRRYSRNGIKGKRKRKKLSSTTKITTKDRLRLSVRPSTPPSSTKGKGILDKNRMMIKSPEELVERFNTGLEIARIAVQDTYASLRNPNSVGAREVGTGATRAGLAMDANWWFWNLLFAASPSIAIYFYCKLIVEPEMKLLNEERKKETAATNINQPEKANTDNAEVSPMQIRRQQQQQQQQQQQRQQQQTSGDVGSSSPLPPNGAKGEDNEYKLLWSCIQPLFSFILNLYQLPLLNHHRDTGDDCDNIGIGTDANTNDETVRLVSSSNKQSQPQQQSQTNRHQEEKQITTQLDSQQRELSELQSRLRILRNEILFQQQQQQQQQHEYEESSKNNRDCDKNGDISKNTVTASVKNENHEAITESSKLTAAATKGAWWNFLFSWWRRRQSIQREDNNNDSDNKVLDMNANANTEDTKTTEKPSVISSNT